MKHINKKVIIIVVVAGLFIGGIIINKNDNKVETTSPIIVNDNVNNERIVVEIKGEVNRPGLYYLECDSRVNDVINLAGGLTAKANTDNLNLALKLIDGMVIYVDEKSSDEVFSKISINKATMEQLMTIDGIGEAKARNIINYRNDHGKFHTLEELKNVSGISESLFQQIKEYISL